MPCEETLKKNFSRNLSAYRKLNKLTQLELAQKLNYSDKSVSKWERGEGLPDLVVTSSLAELLGVSVNDLLSDKIKKRVFLTRNKLLITILSIGLVWFVATVLYFILSLLLPSLDSWLLFIYAIPVSAIVSIVFSAIWWKKIFTFLSVSLLIWSLAVSIVITLSMPKITFLFIVTAVLQILTILFFLLKK